jgi:tripartite-type tricarboxylate transporter receptor subunit TctC
LRHVQSLSGVNMRQMERAGSLARRLRGRAKVARLAIIALAALMAHMAPGSTQDYPSKPIRIIAGAAPGGLIDLFARTFAGKLQERSGQPVLVENNSVATGTIGADLVVKSPPDGYTLLLGHTASMVILPILNPHLPYDATKDLAPIALVGEAANLLLVRRESPANSVQELIALAKAKPGTWTYASQGLGSSAHMATEQFRLAAGLELIHVPYRGSTPAVTDLMSGQVEMMIDTVPFNLGHIQAGSLRALAVAAPRRAAVLPNVPTMAEAGLRGVEGGLWLALFAPAHTPPAVIAYLNKQARDIFALPDVRERLETRGLALPVGSPEDLSAYLAAEKARWSDVVQRAGIKLPQ